MKARKTTIDDLAFVGQELTESHLHLAAGGLPSMTRGGGGGTIAAKPTYGGQGIIDTCTEHARL